MAQSSFAATLGRRCCSVPNYWRCTSLATPKRWRHCCATAGARTRSPPRAAGLGRGRNARPRNDSPHPTRGVRTTPPGPQPRDRTRAHAALRRSPRRVRRNRRGVGRQRRRAGGGRHHSVRLQPPARCLSDVKAIVLEQPLGEATAQLNWQWDGDPPDCVADVGMVLTRPCDRAQVEFASGAPSRASARASECGLSPKLRQFAAGIRPEWPRSSLMISPVGPAAPGGYVADLTQLGGR